MEFKDKINQSVAAAVAKIMEKTYTQINKSWMYMSQRKMN